MVSLTKTLDAIMERCRLSLIINYQGWSRYRAESLFEAEARLIRKLGQEDTLVRIVEYGDHLHDRKVASHLIGAGGSSVIFYLLGFSEVDPVRYGTYFQRLWLTKSGEPPIAQFVVLPEDHRTWDDAPRPANISVHPMTALEAVPELIQRRFPKLPMSATEQTVFEAIQRGDTDGVFQLESEPVRSLLSQVCPSQIKALGSVTALEQISHSHPDVASNYLMALSATDDKTQRPTVEPKPLRPILFQETIMSLLHQRAGIPWEQTYRFVQAAAKARMSDQHDLWKPVLEGLERRCGANGEVLLRRLITASCWSVCRAHHVVNAITSYRAAYYRTFHRRAFEDALQQVSCWERGK